MNHSVIETGDCSQWHESIAPVFLLLLCWYIWQTRVWFGGFLRDNKVGLSLYELYMAYIIYNTKN